jgi:hypothetical protein
VDCAAELAGQPWDAVIRSPGDDSRFREAVFGSGSGILGFYLDDDAQLIRIFDIVWIGQEPVDVEVLTLARLPAVPFAANCWSVDVHQLGRTPERSDRCEHRGRSRDDRSCRDERACTGRQL